MQRPTLEELRALSVEDRLQLLEIQKIKAVLRLRLRFDVELPLKAPDLFRCFEAHCQSPKPPVSYRS
ncbi:MAG: hypothetical protein ACLPWS_12965 [Rhodomicrobium sp.]